MRERCAALSRLLFWAEEELETLRGPRCLGCCLFWAEGEEEDDEEELESEEKLETLRGPRRAAELGEASELMTALALHLTTGLEHQ